MLCVKLIEVALDLAEGAERILKTLSKNAPKPFGSDALWLGCWAAQHPQDPGTR